MGWTNIEGKGKEDAKVEILLEAMKIMGKKEMT